MLLLAAGGASSELLSIWGHWSSGNNKMILHTVRTMYAEMAILLVTAGTLQQAYLEENPLSALVAFAIAGGWDQTSFMRRHVCGTLVCC